MQANAYGPLKLNQERDTTPKGLKGRKATRLQIKAARDIYILQYNNSCISSIYSSSNEAYSLCFGALKQNMYGVLKNG